MRARPAGPHGSQTPLQRIDRRPLYLQVHDILVDRIARGHWRLGDPLPAEGALAEELDVSVGTLRKALELLEAGHIITRQQGRGTFVADYGGSGMSLRFNPFRASDGSLLHGTPELLSREVGNATTDEAARLGLAEDRLVLRSSALRHRDGVPYIFEMAVVPAARFPLAVDPPDPAVTVCLEISSLAQSHGIVVGRIVERVRAIATPKAVAEAMKSVVGPPLLEVDRVTHDVNGDVIEWRMCWCDLADGWYAQER